MGLGCVVVVCVNVKLREGERDKVEISVSFGYSEASKKVGKGYSMFLEGSPP
jgi:predicted DNA-binding antitoxin AbrB/MazE fold protein